MDYYFATSALTMGAYMSLVAMIHGIYVGKTWYRVRFTEERIEPQENSDTQLERFHAIMILMLAATLFGALLTYPFEESFPMFVLLIIGGCEGVVAFFAAEGALAIGQRLSYRRCEERLSKFQERRAKRREARHELQPFSRLRSLPPL